MISHIKLLSTIIILITGTVAGLTVYHSYKQNYYPFLKFLIYHVLFFNLFVFLQFIEKYFNLHLGDLFISAEHPYFTNIYMTVVAVTVFGMSFSMFKIVAGLRDKSVKSIFKAWAIPVILFITLLIIIDLIYFEDDIKFGIFELLLVFSSLFLLFEIPALIWLLIDGRNETDRKKVKISNGFAYLYLARYILIGVFVAVPQPLGTFSGRTLILIFNIIPLIWLKFFFHKYKQVFQIGNDNNILLPIINKYQITKRESEIVKLILSGKSNKEIEDILCISILTVKNHIYNIYNKLGINSRHQLFHFFTKS